MAKATYEYLKLKRDEISKMGQWSGVLRTPISEQPKSIPTQIPPENDEIMILQQKEQIAKLRKEIKQLRKELEQEEQLKDATTSQINSNEKSERGAQLTTAQILHLVHYAKLDKGKATAQEWAAALRLISGCSENTLRQQFNNPNLTDSSKGKVEALYNEKLESIKKK